MNIIKSWAGNLKFQEAAPWKRKASLTGEFCTERWSYLPSFSIPQWTILTENIKNNVNKQLKMLNR